MSPATDAIIFFVFRWIHFMSGITWIGILYYFNFVQVPFMAEVDAAAKPHVIGKLLPRALWWFRWGAMFTFLSGLVMYLLAFHKIAKVTTDVFPAFFSNWFGWAITYGVLLALTMFLNVWLVIWPKQQIVMKSNAQVQGGGAALPEAAGAARRAFLASRTNTLLSLTMLMFMGAGRWLPFGAPSSSGMIAAAVFIAVVIGLIELNALKADQGPTTKPLATVKSTLTGAFVISFVSIVFFGVVFGLPS
jgi:uncharacterized membrane protein